jgi:hypothetical protein
MTRPWSLDFDTTRTLLRASNRPRPFDFNTGGPPLRSDTYPWRLNHSPRRSPLQLGTRSWPLRPFGLTAPVAIAGRATATEIPATAACKTPASPCRRLAAPRGRSWSTVRSLNRRLRRVGRGRDASNSPRPLTPSIPATPFRLPAIAKRPFSGSCQGLNLNSIPLASCACGNRPVRSQTEKARSRAISSISFILPRREKR